MKIQPISNYCLANSTSGNKNSKYTAQNSFISFGINWNKTKLDILNKNPYELREVAQYFHKSTDSELHEITDLYKLRIRKEKAYSLLKNAIELVKLQKDNWLLHLSILKTNEKNQGLTEAEQAAKLDYESKIRDLDDKFESRIEKFEDKIVMPDPEELREAVFNIRINDPM